MTNPVDEWTDAFGKQIADGTRNTIDIPSNYDFSPERLRLFLNGTRQEPSDVSTKFTDGDSVTVINKKPDLQVERPFAGTITTNPTASNPQKTMQSFLPGGTGGGLSVGNRFPGADFELNPGQEMTLEIQNDSETTNRFGFSLGLIETVVR